MAKEHGTSKSQAVRNYLKTHRKATNKEVSEALGKQGVEVTPNHVATIKAKTKTRHKAARAVVSRRGSGHPRGQGGTGTAEGMPRQHGRGQRGYWRRQRKFEHWCKSASTSTKYGNGRQTSDVRA